MKNRKRVFEAAEVYFHVLSLITNKLSSLEVPEGHSGGESVLVSVPFPA